MVDTALGLSPAQWSAIGALLGTISLLYVIWWNHQKEKSSKNSKLAKRDDPDDKKRSRLARQKIKLEKEKMKALKQDIKKIKRDELSIIEDECRITRKKPSLHQIGELSKGIKLEGSFKGTMGGKFSYYILDEVNKDLYKRDGDVKEPIRSGTDENKFKLKMTIPRDNKYYVLFTTRATKNPRNVHYKIKISVD